MAHKQVGVVWLGLALMAVGAAAQTPVTTTGGTTNTIPLFSGTSSVGNSVITQSLGDIGINSVSPTGMFSVANNEFTVSQDGGVVVNMTTGSLAGNYSEGISSTNNQSTPAARLEGLVAFGIANNNAISEYVAGAEARGITLATSGTTVPSVYGIKAGVENRSSGTITNAYGLFTNVTGNYGQTTGSIINAYGAYIGATSTGSGISTITNAYALYLNSPDTFITNRYSIYQAGTAPNYLAGRLGIGTTSPASGALLEVNGNAQLDGNINMTGKGAGITFPDGSVQVVAYTGVNCVAGGDYAESVDIAGDRTNYEPGDVLVIGAESGSDVVKSAEPYSTLVAGIYSTKPGFVGRRQLTDAKTSKTEVPMAMIGIVPTKVSAENGAIKRGDLLVTSSTVGYAMKGTDPTRLQGATVGKALGALNSGKGVIEVLVTLQ